jgi:hypothetical protein
MSSIRRARPSRARPPATVGTVLGAVATTVAALLIVVFIVLVATSPNWVGH